MKKSLEYLGDAYKYAHKDLYSKNITNIFTNLVAREFRYLETTDDVIVSFGANELAVQLNEISYEFFRLPFNDRKYNMIIKGDKILTPKDWKELHELGYLPIIIKAVKDGTNTKVQTPLLHIETTDKRFFWLGQFLETWISQTYWPMVTSAVKSRKLKLVMDKYTEMTSDAEDNSWRIHDFGCRGHQGTEGSILMGQGHLLFNGGSDTVVAQERLLDTYKDFETNPIVNASEHSVMCSHGEIGEELLIKRLLEDYKDTLLSIVIDGFDQDNFIYNTIPKFKETIQKRNIPLVLRPDSGEMTPTMMKYIVNLDNTFGHTINSKGYKVVNNVNLIWGDGCTDENINKLLEVAQLNGYSVDNFLFGVGSFYYVSTTRDSLSIAVKGTAVELDDGTIFNTMKKVKSDPSKASLSGLCAVDENGNVVQDIKTKEEFDKIDTRKTYFKDGRIFLDTWTQIKGRTK